MRLKTLLEALPEMEVKGSSDVEITGISLNSQQVKAGNLFVVDRAHKFIKDAEQAGAHAILTDVYDPFLPLVQVIHPHVASLKLQLARAFYGDVSEKLTLIGVTGTCGKTTTAFLLRDLIEKSGPRCGMMGTVEWDLGARKISPVPYTTTDIFMLYELLHEMTENGLSIAILEVTSHGLAQGRVAGLDFDIGLFTNLSQDHLDYHGTMEAYAAAKAKFFNGLGKEKKQAVAIVSCDSPYADAVTGDCTAPKLNYGFSQDADIRASDLELTAQGSQFTVTFQEKTYPATFPLIGHFNVQNLLAACGVLQALGIKIEKTLEYAAEFQGVPGRLERIVNARGLDIFVDFAHKEDALRSVLTALRPLCRGRLITLFGCGGDRDREKRPKMAAAVEEFSDLAIVTSDNPRTEEPEAIIHEILAGFRNQENALVIVDRRRAIQEAIRRAQPGDLLLIAGRGHEPFQHFKGYSLPFDDREVVREFLS